MERVSLFEFETSLQNRKRGICRRETGLGYENRKKGKINLIRGSCEEESET